MWEGRTQTTRLLAGGAGEVIVSAIAVVPFSTVDESRREADASVSGPLSASSTWLATLLREFK